MMNIYVAEKLAAFQANEAARNGARLHDLAMLRARTRGPGGTRRLAPRGWGGFSRAGGRPSPAAERAA